MRVAYCYINGKCYHEDNIERKCAMKKVMAFLAVILVTLMAVPAVAHASSGITIDGKFDDWKSQPIQKWTTDKYTYHDVGFTTDDKYVYVYINMSPHNRVSNKNQTGYSNMMPTGYKITINHHTYDLSLHLNYKNVDPGAGGFKVGEGTWFNADVWDEHGNHDTFLDNAGYLLREKKDDTYSDAMEVAIPLKTFGDDVNQSSTFTLKNSNLGGDSEITTSGASTAPYVLVAIGAVIAAGGLVIYHRRQKRGVANEK